MITLFGHELGANAVTLLLAVCCVIVRVAQHLRAGVAITTNDSVMALLNGASVFPFLLMVTSAFSTEVAEHVATSAASMSLAGLVGLMFVCGEVLAPEGLKQKASASLVKAEHVE